MRLIIWALKRGGIFLRIYTIVCIIWWVILLAVVCYGLSRNPSVESFFTALFGITLFGAPLIIPIMYARYKSLRGSKAPPLDPFLISVKEKCEAIKKYLKGEVSVTWSPIVSLAHDATLSFLQKLLIDVKGAEGVRIIENLRREKKLNISSLVKILRQAGVLSDNEVKELEMLRDLRNRVVHEDFYPSKQQASWAYEVIRDLIAKKYPDIQL